MINETYVNWLVTWIRNGTTNIKTELPFTIDDIKDINYKTEVEVRLASQ